MSPKTNKQGKRKRIRLNAETRRQQLLSYAIATMAKNGLGQAKHAEIAELAGVAVSTVFFYFPTVDVLNNAVLDAVEKAMESISFARLLTDNQQQDIGTLLLGYFEDFEQIILDNDDYVAIFLEWGSSINNPIWPRYLSFRNKHIKLLTEALHKAQNRGELKDNTDIEATAIMIASVFRMIFKMNYFGDCKAAIKEVHNCLISHILV